MVIFGNESVLFRDFVWKCQKKVVPLQPGMIKKAKVSSFMHFAEKEFGYHRILETAS